MAWSGVGWTSIPTTSTTLWTTGVNVFPNFAATAPAPLPPKPKGNLAWLDDEVEKVCAVAREVA